MSRQGHLIAFLVVAVMTVWVRELWLAQALQAVLFLYTCCVVVTDMARGVDSRPGPIVAVPAAIGVWACLQLGFAITVVPSATRESATYWLAAACLMFLGQRFCATGDGRDRFLTMVVIAGSVICLVGTIQLFTSNGFIFWLFPSGYDSRVIGPFVSPNNYAAFVELLLPLSLSFAFRGRHSYAWLMVAASLFASILASASRAGTLLALLEVAAVLLLCGGRGAEHSRVRRLLLAFVLLAVLFTLVVGYQQAWQRFSESDDSIALRRDFLHSSIAMVHAQPQHGFGLGTWSFVYPQFAIIDPGMDVNHAHNEWIQWAAEGGLPVLILMLSLFAWTAWSAVRSVWGVGLLSVFLHSLVDYPFLRFGLAAWIFVLLGVLATFSRAHSSPRAPFRARRIAGTAIAVILLAAATFATRAAVADLYFRQSTVESVRKAMDIVPDQAVYHATLAQLDPEHAIDHLERALAANPYLTGARLRLGLGWELLGDRGRAAAALLEAAHRDHLYAPSWTLANFYFRNPDGNKFWEWARRAAEVSPVDLAPLFDLCVAVADDADVVRSRIATSPSLNRQLFEYLMKRDKTDALSAHAESLASGASAADLPTLIDYVDRSLSAGRITAAADVWKLLAARKLVTGPVGPESLLSNNDFRSAITGRGFDWRVHPTSGLTCDRQSREDTPHLTFTLSGRQPETCELLSQFVHLELNRSYVLDFEYRTKGLPATTGLLWSLDRAPGFALGASNTWKRAGGEFRPAFVPGRLVLRYARVPGMTRAEGTLLLRNVRLTRVQH